MITYHVMLEAAEELTGQYKRIPITFCSPVVLTERDIRLKAIDRAHDKYVSFGWFTYRTTVEE